MLKLPTKLEVYEKLAASNLHAAPGTDGLTNFFYKKCFKTMGGPLSDVVKAVFAGQQPTLSQRTSKMVFGSKPTRENSCKPGDKRRISLLISKPCLAWSHNASSLWQQRLSLLTSWINLSRDAIQAASKSPKNLLWRCRHRLPGSF